MMPLYTSRELRQMVHACNTHEELDRVQYEVNSLDDKEIPFEIRKKFGFFVELRRIDLNNTVRK